MSVLFGGAAPRSLAFLPPLTRIGSTLAVQRGTPAVLVDELLTTGKVELAAEQPVRQLPPQRDALEYIEATKTLESLPDSRIKRLLEARLTAELALSSVNQSQTLLPAEQPKQYTTATVRAAQLGYSAQQIGSGARLGTFVGKAIQREFQDWQGQYLVWHYEVSDALDSCIHSYFS